MTVETKSLRRVSSNEEIVLGMLERAPELLHMPPPDEWPKPKKKGG